MSNAYGGVGVSLNYRGTNATQPPNYTFAKVDPTPQTKGGATLGDLYMNTETQQVWILVSLSGTVGSGGMVAKWAPIIASGGVGPISELGGDTGVAVPNSAGLINIIVGTGNGTPKFTGSSNQLQLSFDTGAGNLGIGSGSVGRVVTSGANNICIGQLSGFAITSASDNSALGAQALIGNIDGDGNTAIGVAAIGNAAHPAFNTALGGLTGDNYTTTESSNILMGYNVAGTLGESNTLRIGVGTGTGNGQLNRAFIQGIAGVSVSNKQIVTIDTTTGQLGSESSVSSTAYFSAYKSSTSSSVTGDGTDYTIIFDTKLADPSSSYDDTTGIFTAPVTGMYAFNASAFIQNIGAGHTQISMAVNTTSANFVGPLYNPVPIAVGGVLIAMVQAAAFLNAGDTAQIIVAVDNSTKTVDVAGQALGSGVITYVQGYLVS